MASLDSEEENWPDITSENRIKHEILFYSQGPVDGYIIGEHAKDLFLHSRLPITVLSKIWNLADVSNDNLLNVDEFVLCMHLIQGVIKGIKLPGDLPTNLKPKMSTFVPLPAISSMEKEAYETVFQTVDSKRKGYLEALEVKPLFQASMLKPEILAKVWDLSDVNKDGVLDAGEWIIACHLIRLIKQGNDLEGSVNPFTYQPDKISPTSLQARKSRVNQYEEHKQRLMSLKEKRKNQTLQEQKRLDLLKQKCGIEKELLELLQKTGSCPLTADELLNLNSKNTDDVDKLEEIVLRLKKEHEKIRQETVKVILGEQKLQDEIRQIKKDTDELNKRLGTKHSKATKDPDPFHQLYEQRKEERKKSNLSEGEEPEVHYPFKISPFDKEALSWKSLTGSDVFLSNHLVDNNNSKQSLENEIVIENLHEFSDKFIESWSSKKPLIDMEKPDEEDPLFMKVEVKPEEYSQWLGAGWKDEEVLSSDNPQFLRLHKKLVDLKKEMQKLNGDVGGRLMFRSPSEYLARKKEKEEEEQKEKSRFPRRSKSSTEKDYVAKRRSYVIEKDDSDTKDKRSKRGSYTFDHTFDTEPKTRQDRTQRRSLKSFESQIPKPVKSDSLVKNESIKKTRAPLPPSKGSGSVSSPERSVSSPERPKSPAPQPPTVKSPRQQRQESPPPAPVESQLAIDKLKETPDTETQFSSPFDSTRDSVPVQQSTAQSQELVEPKLNSPTYSPRESQHDIVDSQFVSSVNSPTESPPTSSRQSQQPDSPKRDSVDSHEKQSQITICGKPDRPPRKRNIAPQPSIQDIVQTSDEISDQVDNSEIISKNNDVCDRVVKDDNQVTLQEEFVSQQSDIVESGTFTFKQVEIINPEEIQSSSDKNTDLREEDSPLFVNETQGEKNIKGILKRKNQDKTEPFILDIEVLENHSVEKIANNSQENNIFNNLIDEDLDEREIIITHSEKSLPDTVSLTSLTSIESVPPPLPDTIPPFLPDIPPPTPVLSRKIEVRQPDIPIEQKSSTVMMENAEVEEEIVQIQSSAQVQNEPPTSREGVISPHSQKVADLRAEFFGMSKSPPPVISAEEPETTGMDVYLNDLKLEAKTKEFEEEDSDISDSVEEDDYNKVEFKAIFIPGDEKTGALPTSPDEDDSAIHLISYNMTSLQSPESTTDSAFEDMASSMHSNDLDNSNHVSLSSTLEDFPDSFVVKEKVREVKVEFEESDPGSISPPESSLYKAGLKRTMSPPGPRDNKSVIEKANKFSSVINEPPKITIKTNSKEMSTAHIQEVDAQRKAVIQTSTMKRKTVGWSDEEVPSKPTIEVHKTSDTWRENSKTVNGINWEEKPDKVDLYSKNILEDSDTSEVVDCESIADLSSTRNRWESFYRSTSDEPIKPVIKKNSTPAKRWEVKLPYKSDNNPPSCITSPRSPSPDNMSDQDVDLYANESAIDREIRLANEREDMLRKEQEERIELLKRQSESKQNFENKNNNNKEFQTMYHEMTEADRGSELQKRETIIQQEIMENKEREKALKVQTNEDDSDNEATEGVIAKEIRLQKEREEEVSNQYTTPTNGEEITYEEAIGTYQHDGESLIARELREHREREEELQKQRNTIHQMSSPNTTKLQQTVTPTIQKTATPPIQKHQQKPPTPTIQQQSFNSFVSSQSPQHVQEDNDDSVVKKVTKKETPIEREIRLARDRENELRQQKGLPLLVETKKQETLEPDNVSDEEITYRYPSKSDTPSMRKFSSSRLQNELQRQKEREMSYRKEGKIMTTSEEHIEPMKFSEVPTKLTGPVKRNFVIRKSTSDKPTIENGVAESKDNKSVVSPPQPSKEEPKFRVKTGGAAFSYRESRQHAESKIEKELREMREREEELKTQRRTSGVILDS